MVGATSLWTSLNRAAKRADKGRLHLWEWLKEKVDLACYRPQTAPDVVVRALTGRQGQYYILKNPVTKTYYRLTVRDFFLWQRMDGTQTVKDLVVAYFLQYGSFAFARVATLVEELKANLFLTEQPVNVYSQIQARLASRNPVHRLSQFWQVFLEKQFAISGLDGVLGKTYRGVGWLFFTRPLQVLYLLVSAVGLFLFYRAFRTAEWNVVTIGGSYQWGVVGLIVANLASIFVHEMSHALTVKHYGREVRRGGFMLYYGMPAFFVDTMDIWLENKRARLAVTWAGPYSGLILGGLASIAITRWPAWELTALLFQFAFISYVTVFFNLNPLLELDGYFVLMDWLEIPMLRAKSLEFVRSGLRAKVKELRARGVGLLQALASLSREEKTFAVYGALSAVWTVYAISAGLDFWKSQLAEVISSLLTRGGNVVLIALGLIFLAAGAPFVLGMGMSVLGWVRRLLGWVGQRGWLDSTWNVAAFLLLVAVAVTVAPRALPAAIPQALEIAALAGATLVAWRQAQEYAGSRLAPVFRLLAFLPLALLLRQVATLAGQWGLLNLAALTPFLTALHILAYVAALLASLVLFADTNLRELHPAEKGLLLLGMAASYGLVALAWRGPGTESVVLLSSTLLPLLALTLLLPTSLAFGRTHSGPAWATLELALGALLAANWLDQAPLLPHLLLATSFFLHRLAYTRSAYRQGPPEASLDLDDRHRLQRAFGWTVEGIWGQTREMDGDRHAHALAEEFNNFALAAGWKMSLVHGQLSDALPEDTSLIDSGQTYAGGLTLLLDLVAREMGEKLTVRALQRTYDRLPWEEREIAAQYLFPEVERAADLSQQFQATRQDYRGLLRRMPLFATMDEPEIDLLCSRLNVQHYSPGQVIIRQDDRGDRFYIIAQGHVEVTQRNESGVVEVVNQLDRGDYFGEVALLHDAPRNATCRATVPTRVLSLSREDFDCLVKARFALREKVGRSIARADLLRRIPLFAEMDAQQIQLIAAKLREESFEPGAVIIRQGKIGETFYLIESGRVQASVAQDGQEKVVAERGPGEYVGEIALLLEVPRTATVTALTPVHMLALRKRDFDHLVAKHLYVSRGLERETSRRLIDLRRAAEATS